MIEPFFIKDTLNEEGYGLEFLHRKRTNMLDLHKFQITEHKTGLTDVLVLWHSEQMGNKIFIETDGGINTFGEHITKKLEVAVVKAITSSPSNKLLHLIEPIQFVSRNFATEETFNLNEEGIERQFFQATTEIGSALSNEQLSYYGLTFSPNNHQSLVTKLFEKLSSVMGVERKKDKYVVKFFSHGDCLSDENVRLNKAKGALETIGIKVNVESILSVGLMLLGTAFYKIFMHSPGKFANEKIYYYFNL